MTRINNNDFWTVHQPPARRAGRRAFTLLEVIVAVMIVALLATLVVPRVWENLATTKSRVAISEAHSLAKQVQLYCLDNGMTTPDQDFDLSTLLSGSQPYLGKDSDIIDPWGNSYLIIVPGDYNTYDFDVVSYGSDGQPGGEGEARDVGNWEE